MQTFQDQFIHCIMLVSVSYNPRDRLGVISDFLYSSLFPYQLEASRPIINQ